MTKEFDYYADKNRGKCFDKPPVLGATIAKAILAVPKGLKHIIDRALQAE